MTPQEWQAFTLELRHAFRGDFGPKGQDDRDGAAQEATYLHHLGGLPYDVAAAAVALLVEDGQTFLPSVGELRAAVRRITQASSAPFAEVWEAFATAYRQHTRPGVDPSVRDRFVVVRISERCGEGAARWVQARGVGPLAHEPVDGAHAGAVRHRLEAEYRTYVEQAEEDERVGLAVARVECARLGEGRSGLRRLEA